MTSPIFERVIPTGATVKVWDTDEGYLFENWSGSFYSPMGPLGNKTVKDMFAAILVHDAAKTVKQDKEKWT